MSFGKMPKAPAEDPTLVAQRKAQAEEAAARKAAEDAKLKEQEDQRRRGRIGYRSLITGTEYGYASAGTDTLGV